MLVVLREAGVVDAGGQGLSIILEGLRRYAKGEKLDVEEIAAPEPVGVDAATGAVSRDFLVAARRGDVRLLHAVLDRWLLDWTSTLYGSR